VVVLPVFEGCISRHCLQIDEREEQAGAVVEHQSEDTEVHNRHDTEYLTLNDAQNTGHWLHHTLEPDEVGDKPRLSLDDLADNRRDREYHADDQ